MMRRDFEHPLAADAMTEVMEAIMTGRALEDDIRVFLTTLAGRGETAEEIAAAVGVLRAHAVRLPLSQPLLLCDTCGTGGDAQGTINVSTLAALVAAAAGVPVAKHGNRAASSRCGSADVLEALGVNLAASAAQVAASVESLGFGFCFAPAFHPAMKAVAPIRRALGIRTIFNLIGPLANPVPLTFQLVGVSEARLMQPMAEALVKLGIRHGMVVCGKDGLDEVTTTAETEAVEVREGRAAPLTLAPEAVGLGRAAMEALRGGDVAHNAARAKAILQGEPSAQRDLVAFNAACVLYLADHAASIKEGLSAATEVLSRGAGWELLQQVTKASQHA